MARSTWQLIKERGAESLLTSTVGSSKDSGAKISATEWVMRDSSLATPTLAVTRTTNRMERASMSGSTAKPTTESGTKAKSMDKACGRTLKEPSIKVSGSTISSGGTESSGGSTAIGTKENGSTH